MQNYGKIFSGFWVNPDVIGMSDDAKLFAVYVLSNTHKNLLGCYRLPLAYAAADLNWSHERVLQAVSDCERVRLIIYDPQGWLFIPQFLKWNLIKNQNQCSSLHKLLEQIPTTVNFYSELIHVIKHFVKGLSLDFDECLQNKLEMVEQRVKTDVETQNCQDESCFETNSSLFQNQYQYQYQEQYQEQDQQQKQEQEQEQYQQHAVLKQQSMINNQQNDPAPIVTQARRRLLMDDPITLVFQHWQATMKHVDAKLDDKRKSIIQKALKAGYSVEQLCQAITGCSLTPHNIGDNERGQRYDGLQVILRDADQIDRFIHNANHPPKPLNKTEMVTQSNIAVAKEWLDKKQRECEA